LSQIYARERRMRASFGKNRARLREREAIDDPTNRITANIGSV